MSNNLYINWAHEKGTHIKGAIKQLQFYITLAIVLPNLSGPIFLYKSTSDLVSRKNGSITIAVMLVRANS